MIVYEKHKETPLSDFHTELRFDFPVVMPEMLDYYLRKTAIQMAQKANLIRRKAHLSLESGVSRYHLAPPDDCSLVGILSIKRKDGCGIHVVPRTFVAPEGSSCASNQAWYDEEEQVLTMPSGCDCSDVEVVMSVAPTRNACTLPEEFYIQYFDTLLMGTRAALMLIPGRPWSNARLGDAYLGKYENELAYLAVERMTHKQRGAVKVQFGRAL